VSWGISGDVGQDLERVIAGQLAQMLQMAQLQQQQQERQRQAEQFDQRMGLERDALGLREREGEADRELRARELRDRSNQFGMEQMHRDRAVMDDEDQRRQLAGIVQTLPEGPGRRVVDLQRLGVRVGAEDVETPQEKQAREQQELRRIATIAGIQRGPSGPQGSPQWVVGPDGQQAYRVPQPGDKRHDPVAERSASPVNDAEALDTAREVERIAGSLLKHPGLNGAFGVVDSRFPTIRQSTADAEVLRDALTSLLTLENTGKLKGVLSNADMEILRRASSTISPQMSESAARAELERLIQVMQKVTGGATTGGAASLAPMKPVSSREAGSAPSGPKFTILGVK